MKKILTIIIVTVCIMMYTPSISQDTNSNDVFGEYIYSPPVTIIDKACKNSYNGSIEIFFDEYVTNFPLPFSGSYYNTESGDYEEFVITSNPTTISNMRSGDYEFLINIDQQTILEFCDYIDYYTLTSDDIDLMITNTECSINNGSVTMDILTDVTIEYPIDIFIKNTVTQEYSIEEVLSFPKTINNLAKSDYQITINIYNDCQVETTFNVQEITIDIIGNPIVSNDNCPTNTTSIILTEDMISGGTAPYTYLWSNGNTTNALQDQYPGTYTVTITDANMCNTTSSYTIDPLLYSYQNVFKDYCGFSNGQIELGFDEAVTLEWNEPLNIVENGTEFKHSNLKSGAYWVNIIIRPSECIVSVSNEFKTTFTTTTLSRHL
ncbi:MAG: SprB repeat-containing protein [Saprospiraceae bacterium]